MNIIDNKLSFAYVPGYRSQNLELILHHSAGNGTVESVHKLHLGNGWAGIAYHYYVRKDGKIYRGRPESWLGGHTTGHSQALGICFEGNFENELMSELQKKAGAELVADVMVRYPGMKVYKHKDFNATACPGKNFPFDAITVPASPEPRDTDAEYSNEPSGWAAASCKKAVDKGVFKGDGEGRFFWQEPVTREQLAVILDRLGMID